MLNWKTEKGSNIHLLKIGITNCFLVEKNKITLLIDTGQNRFSEKLKSQLSILLKKQNKLDYLILTHTHYDHAENAKMVKQLFSPQLVAHKSETQFLKEGFTRLPRGTNMITDAISGLGNKYARKIGEYNPVETDIDVDDLYLFENIDGIKIIHTPGHTIGSISIIIDDEIALVGDTLFGLFKNKILPPFADNKEDLYKSWLKLLNTSCKSFIPAHGKLIKRELVEKKVDKLNK
jgi:glyoxylase-like metal-dependent hydrolase (beta-lactamase superfamily II)